MAKQSLTEQQQQWNNEFAKAAADAAIDHVAAEVNAAKARGDYETEVYHPVYIPCPPGTPQHEFYEHLLTQTSAAQPAYVDLFEKLLRGIKGRLQAAGLHSFVMLNCRFQKNCSDNLLLYMLASWNKEL